MNIQEIEKDFDEQFIKVRANDTKSGFALNCDPEFAKRFLTDTLTKVLNGLRMEEENYPHKEPCCCEECNYVYGANEAKKENNERINNFFKGI